MIKDAPDPRRLSQLSPDEDPHHIAALVRSAQAAPDEDLPRLRWRLRTSLRHRTTRPPRLLRMALVMSGAFLTGGMVGAAVRPYWEHALLGPTPTAETPVKARSRSIRRSSIRALTEVNLPEPGAVLIEPNPAPAEPAANRRAPQRLARWLSTPPPLPEPLPPFEAPASPVPPSPTALEQALLVHVLKSLRAQHDPRAALALLDDHAKRFPGTVLAPEVAMLRAEALLGLGREAESLAVLDRLPLASMPNRDERLVLRGELRAAAGRWQAAWADFETLLSDSASSGIARRSPDLVERALWGRASARSRLGDEAGARADLASYLGAFPSGRFTTQAAALLRGSP